MTSQECPCRGCEQQYRHARLQSADGEGDAERGDGPEEGGDDPRPLRAEPFADLPEQDAGGGIRQGVED